MNLFEYEASERDRLRRARRVYVVIALLCYSAFQLSARFPVHFIVDIAVTFAGLAAVWLATSRMLSRPLPESALDSAFPRRRFFLFLRPFAADPPRPAAIFLNVLAFLHRGPDFMIAEAFRPFAPVVGIARPRFRRSIFGPVSVRLERRDWITEVTSLASQALGVIVFAPTVTPGFQKELEIIRGTVPPWALFVVVPPSVRRRRWEAVRDVWRWYFPEPLPEYNALPSRRLRILPVLWWRLRGPAVVTFAGDWRPSIVSPEDFGRLSVPVGFEIAALRAVSPQPVRDADALGTRLWELRQRRLRTLFLLGTVLLSPLMAVLLPGIGLPELALIYAIIGTFIVALFLELIAWRLSDAGAFEREVRRLSPSAPVARQTP